MGLAQPPVVVSWSLTSWVRLAEFKRDFIRERMKAGNEGSKKTGQVCGAATLSDRAASHSCS